VPERIEGYDISNIFGKEAVGSMVVFAEGEPDKNEYRKFKIRIGQGQANDVGMLKEIMERRLNNDWPLPDLIIIDGGKGQVNIIAAVLKRHKLEIPLIAISKGDGLRSAMAPDKLFFPGEKMPLQLSLASPAMHLIKRVRDEAHRFAIGYHRKLRSKKFI
jgi:excinuclease ABC subunit C